LFSWVSGHGLKRDLCKQEIYFSQWQNSLFIAAEEPSHLPESSWLRAGRVLRKRMALQPKENPRRLHGGSTISQQVAKKMFFYGQGAKVGSGKDWKCIFTFNDRVDLGKKGILLKCT
jgi:hypothetical protein